MADLIDREELKKRYFSTAQSGGYLGDAMYIAINQLTRLLRLIDEAPTVEPKKGKWEGYVHSAFYGSDDFKEPIFRDKIVWYCSNPKCRRKTVIKENYCPNCGAMMKGESDD